MPTAPITFSSAAYLGGALTIVALAVVLGCVRRPELPRLTKLLGMIGLLLLALAAGGPSWRLNRSGEVAVLVDVSPSTRTADYRDVASLRQRIGALLGTASHRLYYFAGDEPIAVTTDPGGPAQLPDSPTTRTAFMPPPSRAVLLFSDVRFELPASAPPIHVVVEAALEEPADAAVERMEVRGNELVVAVRNSGGPRSLRLTGPAAPTIALTVPPGGSVVTVPLPTSIATAVTARLSAGDAWPENDVLSLAPPPPSEVQCWWVGQTAPGDGWRRMSPPELPTDPAAYMAPSVVVLDNVAAMELDDVRQQRLRQYVRDLGGGVVILGGGRAFAAGGYAGTSLETLSPLASHPPQPAAHWVFLVDSSGSMTAPAPAGGTRWKAAVDAVTKALGSLPPNDLVSVAGFSGTVDWWSRGKPAEEARAGPLPPSSARSSGPTELRRALEAVTGSVGEGTQVELIVLTDANAPVDGPDPLAAVMRERRVRLHLLALGDSAATGLAPLRTIVDATGGTLLRESEPAEWTEAVRRLARAAMPDLLIQVPGRVEFAGALAGTPPITIAPPWNRTWLKPQAAVLAEGAGDAGERSVAAAEWAVGEGKVTAAAFRATAQDAESFVRLVARPPRDPRLRVTWDMGAPLRVTVDAVDADSGALNGLPLALELRDATENGVGAATVLPIPQTAPGRYEVTLESPQRPTFATLRHAGRVAERVALAGRYAPEFDRVGNNRAAMRELAARTGGSVIEPGETRPLRLPPEETFVSLTSLLAALAATCIAFALVWWRVS